MDRNNIDFDHFDYAIIGTDDHLDDIARQAENTDVLRRQYVAILTRDLRGLRSGRSHSD